MPPRGGYSIRIWKGDFVAALFNVLQGDSVVGGVGGNVRIEYDNGEKDELNLATVHPAVGPSNTTSVNRAKRDGWITGVAMFTGSSVSPGAVWVSLAIFQGEELSSPNLKGVIAQGYVGSGNYLQLGQDIPTDFRATWAFQGTVAEDATGGTHVCTLTISPGTGNELEFLAGFIIDGNTATAQTPSAFVTDGTNVLYDVFNAQATSFTTASLNFSFPQTTQTAAIDATGIQNLTPGRIVISGAMKLVLQVSTAAVSVTQTFSAVCRLRSQTGLPTATLADSVGTPVLTTNTNAVF